MQTLTSIRRRGWSGRIASLPLSFLLVLVFFAKATGRTKRVVPLKEVPFGGLNNVPLTFGGKIPNN